MREEGLMKKTTILLLTCALPVMLSACYSTLDEEMARAQKRRNYQSVMGCQIDDVYQNAGYRDCVEATAIEKAKKHKTVYLSEDMEGTSLVVSKGEGDIEMLDPTAVYERVEVKSQRTDEETSDGIVVTDESLIYTEETTPADTEKTVTTTTTTTTETIEEIPVQQEEDFEDKFFKDYTGPSSTQKFEETTEKIIEEKPVVEKIRKNKKENLPTEQK